MMMTTGVTVRVSETDVTEKQWYWCSKHQ